MASPGWPRGRSAVHTTGKKFTILRGTLVLKLSIASRSRHRRDSGHLQTPSQRGGICPNPSSETSRVRT